MNFLRLESEEGEEWDCQGDRIVHNAESSQTCLEKRDSIFCQATLLIWPLPQKQTGRCLLARLVVAAHSRGSQ